MSFTIASTYPVAGSSDFPLDESLQIVFSDQVDESSITASSVILYQPPYAVIPAALTYSFAQKKILVNPDANLLIGTAYELMIVGDVGGVRDVYGNDLTGGSYIIAFTTAGGVPTPSGTYIVGGEFFLDTSGVWGTGTSITASDGVFDSEWEPFHAAISLAGMTLGEHTIYVHGQDNVEWGTVQEIDFEITNVGPTGSAVQSSYVANLVGPATMSLVVSPSPTGGAPTAMLTGILTTRTFAEPPISAEFPSESATEYLEVTSTNPEDKASLVDNPTIQITFNADLSDDYNE